ncbi:hypothetical protein ACTJJM_04835 [Stenotrophomonas sp. 22692]|uniref:GAP1-N1 domain-containing protein n=1 Tax=Stenotrophomonas sp. 22692 TaxID=3453956 RepID=UPI003F848099
MNVILAQQLHGYRQGHQLLSAGVKLGKIDQALVDRLSDVAGPLRPGEKFPPYLSLYPLPSMMYYVVARTWQDLEASRAGCVSTRSIFVPMQAWERGVCLQACVALLDSLGPKIVAEPMQLPTTSGGIDTVQEASATELVEAIFLEDRQPIAVFGSTAAEAIACRLLTAVWPALRRELAISTFALSPRTLGGRSFDIVFSPKDARSKFGEWSGRKIDATRSSSPRHRWSMSIAQQLFQSVVPSLISAPSRELGPQLDISQEADLRIAYLWTELLQKVDQAPHAILGLLDIVNSRRPRSVEAIHALEPRVASSADLAVAALAPADAWRFLLALTDKLSGVPIGLSVLRRIRSAARTLATSSPDVALRSIDMLVESHARPLLLGALGDGISLKREAWIAREFVSAPPAGIIQALVGSKALAAWLVPEQPSLSEGIAEGLSTASPRQKRMAKHRLLPLLTSSAHFVPAAILIRSLDEGELCAELLCLYEAGSLSNFRYRRALQRRSNEISAKKSLMDTAARLPATEEVYSLISEMLTSSAEDLQWVIRQISLSAGTRIRLVTHLVDLASDTELRAMLALHEDLIGTLRILCELPQHGASGVIRILGTTRPQPEFIAPWLLQVLPFASSREAHALAEMSLEHLLSAVTNDSWAHSVQMLFDHLGARIQAARIARAALHPDLAPALFERNVAIIDCCAPSSRQRILEEIELIARTISKRELTDYSYSTAMTLGRLIWDSTAQSSSAQLRASATLLPALLASEHVNAGTMVSATFPPAYQVLRRSEDAFGLLKFFTSHDWGKCRDAREDLVLSYLRSEWKPLDFAITAARSSDVKRIFKALVQRPGGTDAILRIRSISSQLPQTLQWEVETAISDLELKGKLK